MRKDRPPIFAAITTALLALTGCTNDTGNSFENESETPVALFQSPSSGFEVASEVTIPTESPSRPTPSASITRTPEPLKAEEMAEQFGSLWGPRATPSPSPEPSAETQPSETAEKTPIESTTEETESPSPKASPSESKEASTAHTNRYKNGSHAANGTYMSPAGPETIKVELVLQDDTISSVFITPLATNGTSLQMQKLFAEDIGLEVTGQPLNEIKSLGAVNGSSLTTKGFLNALTAIREDAAL